MSTLNDSLIGKQLDEYRIDKALGVGGMARVYRALDTKLRRYVALKVIAPSFRADAKHTERFEREAQSIARLDHPNIVHVYRFGEVGGLYYMAMQYIEGADVAWLIEDYKRDAEVMPLPDVVRIVRDIGDALDYAHSKNVIHRDVKPGNIMVDNRGRAVLTDFGLALLSDVGTHGQIFGSPHYIAPEQAISSGNVVPQSDLYALGATLFEILTGELPFTGGEAMDIAMRHVSEPPPPPSHFNKAIPPAVDDVVLRCLEKEPYARYQTGAELSQALEQAVDNWRPDNLPSTEGVRRPSLVIAPQRVSQLMKSSPVPPPDMLPEGIPTANNLPPLPPTLPPEPSLAQTQAGRPGAMLPPPLEATPESRRSNLLYPLLFGGIFFAIGLASLIFILLVARTSSQGVAALPTVTAAVGAATSGAPTGAAATISANTTPAAPTSAPDQQPTTGPTLTPLPPTPVPPTPTRGPIPPPDDRTVIPPGTRRLGEFAVEAYCTDQGYGIVLTNGNRDWACTDTRTRRVVLVLAPADFDNICRAKYNKNAFALLDQQKEIQAYSWSCYDYVIAPRRATPTAALDAASGAALPSALSLVARYGQDWVALVNISTTPLSLDSVEFRRPDTTLKATAAWGRPVLQPGECVRIYRGDQPPAELPPKCTSVIDYSAPADERQRWFEGAVIIAINPETTYCYPSDQCSQQG